MHVHSSNPVNGPRFYDQFLPHFLAFKTSLHGRAPKMSTYMPKKCALPAGRFVLDFAVVQTNKIALANVDATIYSQF
jgi:hypothetical protein